MANLHVFRDFVAGVCSMQISAHLADKAAHILLIRLPCGCKHFENNPPDLGSPTGIVQTLSFIRTKPINQKTS